MLAPFLMKKALAKAIQGDSGMRGEYDFAGGVRGKHYRGKGWRIAATAGCLRTEID